MSKEHAHETRQSGNQVDFRKVTLQDKFTLPTGQIFLSGVQALVRLLLLQAQMDRAAGLKTAGFVSGYRGSPLGGLDLTLWQAKQYLKDADIHFQPGINEDLGATAVWGSQQTNLYKGARVDGVFGLWYGKGPGVDRSGDVLKHANMAGTSRLGGVLALAGDDHLCKSSTLPHQSDYAFMDAGIPVLAPSNVQEIIDLGIYGWALSRYSGCWVGFKILADIVDTSATILINPEKHHFQIPQDLILPANGVSIRWPDRPVDQEKRHYEIKLPAAQAFARANRLNQRIFNPKKPRLLIVTSGKSYGDVRQFLENIGLGQSYAEKLGIGLYKVGMTWPMDPEDLLSVARGIEHLWVVEEKRPLMESQIRDILYRLPADQRPDVWGKTDPKGQGFLPIPGGLEVAQIRHAFSKLVHAVRWDDLSSLCPETPEGDVLKPADFLRIPYYCSGCPHNTSTLHLPEGSRAIAGIGCHYMATWIDKSTQTFTQMGGEGVTWIGQAPFTSEKHVFVNLGDGTYYHSGILAIRASVAAKVNVTYKILYNDAVAMTGGQPVDGPLNVAQVTQQLAAEGVQKIVVVADDPQKYPAGFGFAPGVTLHPREELSHIQRELIAWPGVSALIYDQTCAAEKRRRRKRGLMEDPARRLFINERVCEGCGDCSKASNCLSVVPVETEFGSKRHIDQSSCNKDYACVKGFCPSFVSVIGGTIRKSSAIEGHENILDNLPNPKNRSELTAPYAIYVTGVGGTGVVTIGALLGMAAHLEGKGASIVDMTGLAQKGGAVVSHVRLSPHTGDILTPRVPEKSADLVLGSDLVVSSYPETLALFKRDKTHVLLNTHQSITGNFPQNPDIKFPGHEMEKILKKALATADQLFSHNITALAEGLLGDALFTNTMILGIAYQRGLIPLSQESLEHAIVLNGAMVDKNIQAFRWGRRVAIDAQTVIDLACPPQKKAQDHHLSQTLEEILSRRKEFLKAYQNEALAVKYENLVRQVEKTETNITQKSLSLTRAVAENYFKLLSYKDEYEVARLYADGSFKNTLKEQFDGNPLLQFHLAPPLLSPKDPITGHPRKLTFGPWILHVFKLLAPLKILRGTMLDIFGFTAERKMERALIKDYEALIAQLLPKITPEKLILAIDLAKIPQEIRGFGHIKMENYKNARAKEASLLSQFYSER